MNRQQNVIQKQVERKQQTTFAKVQVIAASRRIHKSSCSDVWMIESDTVKDKFYCVQYVAIEEGMKSKTLVCDCPPYTYNVTVPCKHIIATAIKVTS